MRLIGPKGSDKYNPGDLELLLWISMLIGFLDLTDLGSLWRGTASSRGEEVCVGVSREQEGEREKKRESRFKKKREYCSVNSRRMRSGGVWKILPISMWKQKGSDRRGNSVMIDVVTSVIPPPPQLWT